MTTPVELVIQGRDETGGVFTSAESGLSKIGQIAGGILASQVFTKLAGAVKDFAVSIVDEAREAALGQAQLQSVLDSTGGVAGVTADQVNKLADKYQYLSKFTDDQIVAGETMMLQFTNIGKDIFPAATQAAIDLAARTGGDLQNSFQVVARALERPEEGIGRLNMAFKLFSDDELKTVQKMAESGDLAGAQAAILERLAQKVGGAAAAQVQPWENVKKRIYNMKESLGTALLPVIDKFGTMFGEALDNPRVQAAIEQLTVWLGTNLPIAADKLISIIQTISDYFNSASGDVNDFIGGSLEYLADWWDTNGENISASAKQIFEGSKTAFDEISATIGPFIATILEKFKAWFTENGPLIAATIQVIADVFTNYLIPAVLVVWRTIQPIIGGLVDLILGAVKIIMQILTGDWAGAWETAKSTVVNVFNALVEAAMNLISGLLAIFGTSVPEIAAKIKTGFDNAKKGALDAFNALKTGAVSKFNELKTGIANKVSEIVSSIRTKLTSFRELGKSIIDGLKLGIQNAWTAFVEYFKNLIRGLISTAMNALLSKSPSRVFIKIGETIPQGLGVGIGSAFPGAVGAMQKGLGSLQQTVSNRTVNNQQFYNFGTYNGGGSSGRSFNLLDALKA